MDIGGIRVLHLPTRRLKRVIDPAPSCFFWGVLTGQRRKKCNEPSLMAEGIFSSQAAMESSDSLA